MSVSVDVGEKDNGRWEVRWRQDGRRRGRTFNRRRDADRFAREVRTRLEGGGIVKFDVEIPTLAEYVETWWVSYAIPNLAPKTRDTYGRVWEKHIRPRLGDLRLRQVNAAAVDLQLLRPMRKAGAGDPVITKTLTMLQSVMSLAVVHHPDVVPVNPVAQIKKPAQKRREAVPIWPTAVEQLRTARWTVGEKRPRQKGLSVADQTMVSLLAYQGLRPGELLALEWRDIRDDFISVERAVSVGEVREDDRIKRHDRRVDLLGPVAADLREYRMSVGRPTGRQLLFPKPGGGHWLETDWRNWRKRVYVPAAEAVGLKSTRPYDLRGSYVSLLVQEGKTIVEVAALAGHTPETCLRHYARLFRDAPAERVSAEDAIRSARNSDQQRFAV